MKFTCDKSAFLKEITFAQEIISSKSTVSVLSSVYLETSDNTLVIRATDVKICFETHIPVQTTENGAITIFCDKLSGILSNLPEGPIEIEQKDSKVIIKPQSKKAQFNVKTISCDQFPQLPDVDEEKYFIVSVSDFKSMIQQTVFAVSDDETRYFMNGVYFERLTEGLVMVATDGRRLAYTRKNLTEGIPVFDGIIIPPKILNVILRRASNEGQIFIAVTSKNLFIKFGQYKLSTILMEGKFPNYQKVIPESQSYTATIKRQDITDALKRVSIFVEQKSKRMFFQFANNKIIISSEESDIGIAREEIPCQYDGPESVISMNYRYVEEPLRAIDTDEIDFMFTEVSRAITLTPKPSSDYFHILMPMQGE